MFFQASFRTPFFLLSFIRRLRNAPCVCHRLHSPMLFIDRIAEFIGICPVFFPVTEICFDMPPDIFRVLHSIRLSVYFANILPQFYSFSLSSYFFLSDKYLHISTIPAPSTTRENIHATASPLTLKSSQCVSVRTTAIKFAVICPIMDA